MTVHALSFDVENWYDGNLHRQYLKGADDRRVVAETESVLALLERHGVKATFFVLGTVARDHPDLVRAIAAAGHEVGCHGWDHTLVSKATPAALLADLTAARALLRDLSGQAVAGFRAPSWSIDRGALDWAPAAVAAAGFSYDSSVFPFAAGLYGVAGAPLTPWRHRLAGGGSLPEVPPAVARIGPLKIPFGGGLYWRVLPRRLLELLFRRAKSPACFYLHPWELNPNRPPLSSRLPMAARVALTWRTAAMAGLLDALLSSFHFAPITTVYADDFAEGVGTGAADPLV